MKIVINVCYGGFGLSNEARVALIEGKSKLVQKLELKKGEEYIPSLLRDEVCTEYDGAIWADDAEMHRDHADLIAVIEKLGEKANGKHAKLAIADIPDGVDWEIEEYDGTEHVAEKHRTWR